jgi:hypothetical protein
VDGLGNAFADPVEIRRFVFFEVKEWEDGPLRRIRSIPIFGKLGLVRPTRSFSTRG